MENVKKTVLENQSDHQGFLVEEKVKLTNKT